jgi:hypothetical protein
LLRRKSAVEFDEFLCILEFVAFNATCNPVSQGIFMTTPRVGLAVLGPALAFALLMSNYVCSSKAQIKPEAFHWTIDGSQVDLYTLKNSNGLEATITNYGGIVVSLTVPDKNAKPGDVVLGYDMLNDHIGNTPYFGALIGRYGNRIAKGRFAVDGVEYQPAQNNAVNALHGGRKGFDRRTTRTFRRLS